MTASISPDISIVSVEHATKPGMAASLVFGTDAGPDKAGWIVDVEFSDGTRASYSKLDGSATWRHDGEFAHNGMPRFCHGHFSCLSSAADEMADVLDAAVAAS